MTASTKRYLIIGALLAALAAGGWFFGSPWWTVNQIKSAVEERDADKLSSYVDYPVLRENIKLQVKQTMAAEIGDKSPAGAAAFGMMDVMVGAMIDNLITPATIQRMIADGTARTANNPGSGQTPKDDQDLSIEHGLNRFNLVAPGAKPGEKLRVEFTRYGLGWKMTNFQLPQPGKRN